MIRYYLLDTIDLNYTTCLDELRALHSVNHPNNKLSIVYSNDMTEALVKVDNIDLPTNGSCILEIFDENNKQSLYNTIYLDPSWDIDERTLEQKLLISNKEKLDRT